MRAIIIDPLNKEVREVEYNGDYREIYKLIKADCFDIVRLGDAEDNTCFVDDEGLLNGATERIGMFMINGDNPAFLAGYGLILAGDDEGNSVGTTMTLDELRAKIEFGIVEKGMYPQIRFPKFGRTIALEW